jgi:ferredoxin-NADP reductase
MILIAGGIGVAPFRSFIRYALEKPSSHDVVLFYSARTPGDFAFKEEFDHLAAHFPRFRCFYTVTRESRNWNGRIGRIDIPLLKETLQTPKTLFYLCGPQGMVDALSLDLETAGIPKAGILSEVW